MSPTLQKKAARSTGVTLARLVDLSNFIVAFDTYRQILALQRIENDPLLSKGRILAKRFLVALQEGVGSHLAPIIMERPDAAIFRPILRQAQRPGSPETVAPKLSTLLTHFFPWIRTRQAVFASLFSGRAAKAAREVAMVVQEESLESRLNKAAMIAPVSGLMAPRKWVEQAASAAGVPLSPVESLRTDAQVAQDLSTQLLQVESKLQGANPQTPEAADLEGERLSIMDNMERLAEQSASPDVIKAIAVAPSPHPEHATATGKKLGMTPEQEEAMMLTGKGIIAAGAGSGKCIVGNSLVQTENGFIPIGDLAQGLAEETDRPLVILVQGRSGPEKTSHIYSDGLRITRRLATCLGYEIEGTVPHRILALQSGALEWVRLSELVEGDVVCIDRRKGLFAERPFQRVPDAPDVFNTNASPETSVPLELTPQVASLLGWIVSEGYVRKNHWNISLTTTDPVQRALYLEAMSGLVTPVESEDTRHRKQFVLDLHRSADIRALMGFGLTRTLAGEKEIPAGVLRSPKPVVRAFLRSLFDGDGWVENHAVGFCTASTTLAHQVHVLLVAFGIPSRRKFRPNKGQGAWHFTLSGQSLRVFSEEIGFGLPSKAEQLAQLTQREANTNINVIPGISDLCRTVKDQFFKRFSTTRSGDEGYGTFKCLVSGSRRPSFSTLQGFLDFYRLENSSEWDALKALCDSEWFFDTIVEITEHTAPTYDFVVPGTHSFSANGFINHNTRVLAGKVVDTIERLGARSSQIIATSFSSKSAAELTSRVKNYGGGSILDAGSDGFGTTHSIGKRMLHEFDPAVPKGITIQKPAFLMKMAMEQVKMYPSSFDTPQMPTPMGMFEGIFGKATRVTNPPIQEGLVTPSPEELAAMDPATVTFQKLLGELQGLAQWGKDRDMPWAFGDLRVLEPLIQEGKGPGELTGPEKAALNKLLSTNRAQKKLRYLHMSPSYKVAHLIRLAATSVYWKQPANQWFNIGLQKFEDAAGRAIGPRRCETAISQFRADLITPEQAWSKEQSQFAAVYGAYVWLKENDPMNSGSIDFDDMLQKAVALLVRDPRALATMQARFKYVFVDEAQDQNRMQHLLFGLIAGTIDPAKLSSSFDIPSIKAVSYNDGRMSAKSFVFVGDDKQAIFEFRGARPDEFIEKSDLVEGDFKTVVLSTNFRSGEAIVDAANKLISHNSRQIPMTCDSNPEKGKGSIHNIVVADHQAGAELAADEIQQATSGEEATASYSDFGVAVRTNAEAYAFGVEMIRRGIPFRSKVNFFNDSTTQAILYWLRLAGADSGDKNTINECVLNAHKAPKFLLDKVFETNLQSQARGKNYLEYLESGGWENIYPEVYNKNRDRWEPSYRNRKNVKPYMDTLVRVFNMTGSPEELLGQILTLQGTKIGGVQQTIVDALVDKVKGSPDAMDLLFEEVGAKEDVSDEAIRNMALAPIQPLMSLIGGYEDIGPALDYVSKLQRANEKQGKKDDPKAPDYNEPAVVIDTCHGWKGLEVPHLYIPMARGVFPHKRSEEEGEEAMASERRLAYVALTRGEQSVTVINPMVTHTGQPGGVSPFVSEACIKPPGHEDPSTDAAPARTTPERTAFLLAYAKGDFEDEAEDTLAAWEMEK